MFPTDLANFDRTEFNHPDMMYVPFLRWLDKVRSIAGVRFELTDDGRADGNPEPSGSAGGTSLHHRGCAVDIRIKDLNAQQLWKINFAIVLCCDAQTVGKVEVEWVKGITETHLHLGLDWTPKKQHEFILAND